MRQGGHRPKVPASLANIDLDRVRRALFRADGNVTKAAKALKVNSADLRRLTWRHPTLIMDALEHAHRMIDKAEENLRQALARRSSGVIVAGCDFSFCRTALRLASAAGVGMAAAITTTSIHRRLQLRRPLFSGRAICLVIVRRRRLRRRLVGLMRMGRRTGSGIEVGRLVGMISDKTCRRALGSSGHMAPRAWAAEEAQEALNRWVALVAAQ